MEEKTTSSYMYALNSISIQMRIVSKCLVLIIDLQAEKRMQPMSKAVQLG